MLTDALSKESLAKALRELADLVEQGKAEFHRLEVSPYLRTLGEMGMQKVELEFVMGPQLKPPRLKGG